MSTNRIGNYMLVSSGHKFWPRDPRAEEIRIEDIAHHLSCNCRWGGAVKDFYSVAEHSVYVSRFCDPEDAMEGLLHDASESYIGDLIRPLKYDPAFAEYHVIEELNEFRIAQKFGLKYPWPPSVKRADEAVCAAEWEQIIRQAPNEDWEIGRLHDNTSVAPVKIACLLPNDAERLFLERYHELEKLRV
jgi:5'-deoxynucleotidase YfbR-like HD superfamily hydrolase